MTNSRSQRKPLPPYGSVEAFRNFLDMLERRTTERVTEDTIQDSKLTSKGNEYKLLRGLRFLDLIDKEGYATEKLRSLHFVGKTYTRNLEKVVREAYDALFADITLETDSRADVTNSIMRVYGVARGLAREAVRIFVYLAEKAEIPLRGILPTKEVKGERSRQEEIDLGHSRILFSAEMHNGNFKKGSCVNFTGDICEAWSWGNHRGLNRNFILGNPLRKGGRLFVNPHPFFCASCPKWYGPKGKPSRNGSPGNHIAP